MVTVTAVRHAYPENAGFSINRPAGHGDYTFLHFITEITFVFGGETVRARPDACIVFDKTAPQRFYSDKPVLHDWMHFTCTDEKADLAGILPNRIFHPVNGGFVTAILQEIEREFFSDLAGREKMIAAKFDELMIRLKRSVKDGANPVAPETAAALEQLRHRVFSDLSKNYTVAELARSVNFSVSRFFSLYKAMFGISPVNDAILTRINAAKNMLASGKAPVKKIAADLGYASSANFIRQFVSRTGFTPTCYREAMKTD